MSEGLYTVVSGANAQQRALEVIANNLANMGSTGFKADRLSFSEILGRSNNPTIRQVAVNQVAIDFRPGPLEPTGNGLDVAVAGKGFFTVSTPEGERYTRAGAFAIGEGGVLVTPQGQPVMGDGGNITLMQGKPAHIDAAGGVWSGEQMVGRLRIVEPSDVRAVRKEGAALFTADSGVMQPAAATRLEVGVIERANVNPILAMSELVMVSRAHEMYHRAIEMYHEIDQKTANESGR